ncbi:MAG: T9SS type A sorting domain-containing protein [Cytophagaceae bacterium]
MKRNLLVILNLILLFCSNLYGQDARISGGNNVSAMICSNGDVYTWGNNAAGLMGSLGNGAGYSPVTSPMKVLFPTNDPYFSTVLNKAVTMYGVDAGSGQSFVSMDCYGGVWGWGFNNSAMGITGTGSVAAAVTTPARVLRGETPGGGAIHSSLSNFLVDAKYVVGGNASGYAVLKNGLGVAWGDNSSGQLGDGTNTTSPTPRYIRVPGGAYLENIIQIDAGDQTAYALVDPDGDGIGTVYSFGGGSVRQLGRNAAGNANGGAETANDPWARPVIKLDGTVLSNIVTIAAGDAMCFALDADGFIWAWGNNGWNNLCGTGFAGSHSDPKRVAAGEWGTTAGAGMGEPYLKAKSIAAGNGFGMAITTDGKPMAWGNNGACGTSAAGGSLGDGTNTNRSTPVFIKRSGGSVDNNVSRISGGDTYGFYITIDNQIFTWGNNANGTLGIGSTTCQINAVSMTPACSLPDPSPEAMISPRSMGVCSPVSQVLDCGFIVSASIQSRYDITWERSNDGTTWTTVQVSTAANRTYTATQPGWYKVTVHYNSDQIPCVQDAKDSINLYQFTMPFTGSGSFCPPTAQFQVTNNPGYTGWYNWYNVPSGGSELNAAYTTTISVDVSQAVYNSVNNTYSLYVQDYYGVEGYARTSLPSSCATSNATPSNYHHRFTVASAFTLESVMALHYTNSNFGTLDQFRVVIYADNAGAVGAAVFTGALSGYVRGPVGTVTPITIPVNWNATAGTYWLRIESTTSGLVRNHNCSVTFPQVDNSGQNLLSIISTRQFGNPSTNFGTAYNWKITRGQPYPCGRLEIVATENCPAPVSFLEFTGKHINGVNLLSWSTAQEFNNSGFVIQRSEDGIHFDDLGFVTGTGNSNSVNHYSFTDLHPGLNSNFYRIKQIDFNGSSSYTDVVIISTDHIIVNLYPNPSLSQFHLIIHSNSDNAIISVVDVTGVEILKRDLAGINEFVFGENLPKGIYLIRIISEDFVKVIKAEKQ